MRTTKSCGFVRLQLAFVNLPLGILYQENFLHQSLHTIRSKHKTETINNVEALPQTSDWKSYAKCVEGPVSFRRHVDNPHVFEYSRT